MNFYFSKARLFQSKRLLAGKLLANNYSVFFFSRFFLMYLIGKDPTEYTGQETYVWDMYKQRCWDFFPAGDCFRKQYESELEGGGGG